jgi:hypothetical protein
LCAVRVCGLLLATLSYGQLLLPVNCSSFDIQPDIKISGALRRYSTKPHNCLQFQAPHGKGLRTKMLDRLSAAARRRKLFYVEQLVWPALFHVEQSRF